MTDQIKEIDDILLEKGFNPYRIEIVADMLIIHWYEGLPERIRLHGTSAKRAIQLYIENYDRKGAHTSSWEIVNEKIEEVVN